MANNEKITGLEGSTNFEQDEKTLLAALLEASDYKSNTEGNTRIIAVKKNDIVLFRFRVRALSQMEVQAARKKATREIPNPAGDKFPAISGEMNLSEYHSNLIYTATVEEDRKKVWNNKSFMENKNILNAEECIDLVLKGGIKEKVVNVIFELSGYGNEDVVDDIEFIKN